MKNSKNNYSMKNQNNYNLSQEVRNLLYESSIDKDGEGRKVEIPYVISRLLTRDDSFISTYLTLTGKDESLIQKMKWKYLEANISRGCDSIILKVECQNNVALKDHEAGRSKLFMFLNKKISSLGCKKSEKNAIPFNEGNLSRASELWKEENKPRFNAKANKVRSNFHFIFISEDLQKVLNDARETADKIGEDQVSLKNFENALLRSKDEHLDSFIKGCKCNTQHFEYWCNNIHDEVVKEEIDKKINVFDVAM